MNRSTVQSSMKWSCDVCHLHCCQLSPQQMQWFPWKSKYPAHGIFSCSPGPSGKFTLCANLSERLFIQQITTRNISALSQKHAMILHCTKKIIGFKCNKAWSRKPKPAFFVQQLCNTGSNYILRGHIFDTQHKQILLNILRDQTVFSTRCCVSTSECLESPSFSRRSAIRTERVCFVTQPGWVPETKTENRNPLDKW